MTRTASAAIAALTLAASAIAFGQQIKVQVDGNAVYFPRTRPQYVNGRVLVPLRGVFEQMGASVNWNPSTRMVSAVKDGKDVELHIGDQVATVDGKNMNLDVPAMIIGGSTMVPIRFLSEALGAQVGWMEADRLVSITTGTTQTETIVVAPRHLRRVVLEADEVIPVTLDQTLSTSTSSRGDTFTATVRTKDLDSYADIPRGTKIEGHVAAVHPRSNNRPAILDISFDKLRFPGGKAVRIDGTLTSLDSKYVAENENGRIVSRRTNGAQDQRMVYAGYGAGAGLLVGVINNRPLEGTILGGALGYIVGQVQHDQHMSSRITLNPGTEMGVRIKSDVTTGW